MGKKTAVYSHYFHALSEGFRWLLHPPFFVVVVRRGEKGSKANCTLTSLLPFSACGCFGRLFPHFCVTVVMITTLF